MKHTSTWPSAWDGALSPDRLPRLLLPWYQANARVLPWRRDREPYHVWLSEIMLQQTRVEAVREYYLRFLDACPDVTALAAASEDRLQKLWQGLGYYSRVRNLQKAAQVICRDWGGQFPRQHADILALPGIGPYTAGAIASICFEQPEPAVDGNVIRVLTRVLAESQPADSPQLRKWLTEWLRQCYLDESCTGQRGAFTQSLMELGALVCLPNGAPDCQACPLQPLCAACREGNPLKYPVKSPRKTRRQETMTVFVLRCDGREAVRRRPDTGLLAGLWEYPHVPGTLSAAQAVAQAESWGVQPLQLEKKLCRRHIFTHVVWDMTAYYLDCRCCAPDFFWADDEQMARQIALPTAFGMFRQTASDTAAPDGAGEPKET